MSAFASVPTGGRIVRGPAAIVLLPFLLAGCVANYSIQHEDPIEATPDAAVICKYSWSVEGPYFRADSPLRSLKWGQAANFGHHNVAVALRDLTSGCPDSSSGDKPGATVSAHVVRDVNTPARVAAMPVLLLSAGAFGVLPVPLSDHFAVCLEIASSDGLRRAADARGQLDRLINMWGTTDHRLKQGRTEQAQKVDEAIREVTVQAWRKAWAPTKDGSRPIVACRDELDGTGRDHEAAGQPRSRGSD